MKKFLSMALALAMTLSLVVVGASAKDFTDKSKITYGEAVDVVSTCKIIDGYTDGSFNPSATLTRGAAAKIICNMVLGPTTAAALGVSTAPFKDVSVSNVFAGYIAYCAKQGIINGYADKTFRPSGTVTGYQFLKMLLGALGYDASIEGYTGANWEVNVAKQASNLKLTSGNSKFTGSAAMTREEACLYAYNTLCTTLVEYADKGQTITVNGVTITQSASKPSVVTSTVAKEQRISTKKVTNSNAYTVEFGERYFPNLVLTSDNDAFMRPTEVWYYGSKLIGSYAIDADKTYTTKTTLGTIYTDLGLTSKLAAADVTVYRDGVKEASFSADITKGSDTKLLGTGTGVKTDLFYSTWYDDASSSVKRSLTICEMNTYVGDVTSKVAKTAAKDAYVTVAARTDDAKSQAYPSGNFETENFAVNDVVLYNYSKKTGSVGIQDMTAAKTATGKLTAFTSGDKCTIGGTTYNYTATVAREATSAAANTDVTVVLDTYGNAIDVVGKTSTQYAYVLNWSGTNGLYGDGTLAKLLLTDGTVVDATLTTKDGASNGAFVTYTVNGDGKYTLSPLAQTTANTENALAVDVKNGDYTIDKVAGVADLTANGNTIFLVATTDAAGNAVYNAYNGIKNVPTMVLTAGANAPVHSVAYCKAGKLATVVFVDATKASSTSISNPSSDQIFVKAPTTTTLSYTYGVGNYYKYDAVVNGTAKTGDDGVMVGAASLVAAADAKSALNAAGNTAYGLFDSNNKDSKNVYSLGVSNSVVFGTGAYKQANDVIGTLDVTAVGGNTTDPTTHVNYASSHTDYAFYNVATGATMTVVDVDGNIVTGQAASAIINDSNDLVWFKLNASNEITAIYVVKVANGEFTSLTNNVTGGNAVAPAGYQFALDANNDNTADAAYAATLSNVMYGAKVLVEANTNDYAVTSSTLTLTQVTAPDATHPGVYSFVMPVAGVTAADFTCAPAVHTIAAPTITTVEGYTVTANKTTAVAGDTVTYTVTITAGAVTKTVSAVAGGNSTVVSQSVGTAVAGSSFGDVNHTTGTAQTITYTVEVGHGNVAAFAVTLA